MNPLRILAVTIEPPIPFGNAAARWYYVLLRGLCERGHRVTAFSTCRDPRDRDIARELFSNSGCDLRCYVHPKKKGALSKLEAFRRPHSYMFSPQMRRDLDGATADRFDVLHMEQLWSGWLGLRHAERGVINIHYLFDIDLAGCRPGSATERLRSARVRRAGRFLIRRYPTICTVSPRLRDCVREISPRANVHAVPLAMDFTLYPFRETDPPRRDPVVALIGSFDWQPTFEAGQRLVNRIWPEIRRSVPNARLQLVGRGARTAFPELDNAPGIAVHQDVPDVLPFFSGSDVLLYAPYRGSGMKVKVLEAFALGVPVVTTPEGVEGIPARDGVHAGIAEDDAGLIERTVGLLHDASRRRAFRCAARTLVVRHCEPARAIDSVENIYAEIAEKHSRGAWN